jgi:hypothetical protein
MNSLGPWASYNHSQPVHAVLAICSFVRAILYSVLKYIERFKYTSNLITKMVRQQLITMSMD